MVEIEKLLVDNITGVNQENLRRYLVLRGVGESLVRHHRHNNRIERLGGLRGHDVLLERTHYSEFSDGVAREKSADPGVVKAVLTSMAAADIHWAYGADVEESFSAILPESVRGMAADIQDAIRSLKSKDRGDYLTIDIDRYLTDMNYYPGGEVIILQGLNGSGKSTVISALLEVSQLLGIEANAAKFPDLSTDTGTLIDKLLKGGDIRPMGGKALQMLFLANFINWWEINLPDSGVLFADRASPYDVQVFGPKETGLMGAMALTEIMKRRITTIVVDRHPESCLTAVSSRLTGPRIFERKSRQMAEQQVELWRLLKYRNTFVLNTDMSTDGYGIKDVVDWSKNRAVTCLAASGFWSRSLLQQGLVRDITEANEKVEEVTNEWYWKMRENANKQLI